MRFMVTISGPFEGMDPTVAQTRTMTIGRADVRELPEAAGAWAHDVVARMLDLPPDRDDTIALWDAITDGAA